MPGLRGGELTRGVNLDGAMWGGRAVRSRVAQFAAAALAVALLAALAQASVAGAKVHRGPAGLAFYDPPGKRRLPHGSGKPIWVRKAKGLVPLGDAKSTRLLLYTSTTPEADSKPGEGGKRIAVSGSVSIPKGKPPKKGWPVITYAHGTTGIADVCAPSRNKKGGPVVDYVSYVDPQLSEWLRAGYAVVRTDYEGLGTPGVHPYLIGGSEANSVLDIVRAARKLDPRIGKRYLIAGHSQGGHAALFAAGAAEKVAPKLKLRGTVAYAPASHLYEQEQALPAFKTPGGLSALAAMILEGASTAADGIGPELLTPGAQALYPQVDETCLPQLGQPDSIGAIAPADLLRPGADLSGLEAVLKRNNPVVSSSQDIFIAQGTADTTVFPFLTDTLHGELEAAGNSVTYKKYPGVTHGEIVAAADGDVLPFIESHLPPG